MFQDEASAVRKAALNVCLAGSSSYAKGSPSIKDCIYGTHFEHMRDEREFRTRPE